MAASSFPTAGDSLGTRSVSGFALSISTSLALESIFSPKQTPYDPDRPIPVHVDLHKAPHYKEIWINVSTLYRNMVSSISKEAFMNATPVGIKDAITTEIDVINSLFAIEGDNLCKPMYYHCTYKGLRNKLPSQVLLREEKSEAQKFNRFKLDRVLDLLHKDTDQLYMFDYELHPPSRTNALILTHVPYDLLSHKNFSQLDLLESNTGKLKRKYQWNSKYYPLGDNDMSILPFNRKLLLVFGDRVLIHPADMKLRKLVMEVAKNRQWTALTTRDKILMDFELDIKEPFVLDYLKKL